MSTYFVVQAQQSLAIQPQGNDLIILARIVDSTGTLITSGEVSETLITVVDLNNPTTTTTTGSFTILGSISLVNWNIDNIGYNCVALVSGEALPSESTYQIEIQLLPPSGDPFTFTTQVETTPIY